MSPGGSGGRRCGARERQARAGVRAALAPWTARRPRQELWEAAAARPPGSSQRLGVGLPVSRPLGLARNVRRQRRWIRESRLQLWLHRIFFLILQDGELPLISLLLWRFIDTPLSPITQHSSKKRVLEAVFSNLPRPRGHFSSPSPSSLFNDGSKGANADLCFTVPDFLVTSWFDSVATCLGNNCH